MKLCAEVTLDQNIELPLAVVWGTGWTTSQCFNNFPVLQSEQFNDRESRIVHLSFQMNVQRDQVVVGQRFRNYNCQLWVFFCIPAMNWTKPSGPSATSGLCWR